MANFVTEAVHRRMLLFYDYYAKNFLLHLNFKPNANFPGWWITQIIHLGHQHMSLSTLRVDAVFITSGQSNRIVDAQQSRSQRCGDVSDRLLWVHRMLVAQSDPLLS